MTLPARADQAVVRRVLAPPAALVTSAREPDRVLKAEVEGLRHRMRALGFDYGEAAGELARRYRLRPREAYRFAYGWSLDEAAAQFNARAMQEGAGPPARAIMTGNRLYEFERWPFAGYKPSVDLLLRLARVYDTHVLSLLDFADHENLAPADRLTLLNHGKTDAAQPAVAAHMGTFAAELRRMVEARCLSQRELARRVRCDTAYISRLVNAKQWPSRKIAAQLDEVLGARGTLIACASMDRRARQQTKCRPIVVNISGPVNAAGISAALPHTPIHLLIEVSSLDTSACTVMGAQLGSDRECRRIPAESDSA